MRFTNPNSSLRSTSVQEGQDGGKIKRKRAKRVGFIQSPSSHFKWLKNIQSNIHGIQAHFYFDEWMFQKMGELDSQVLEWKEFS